MLRIATSEEILARDPITHVAWGTGLTVPQYQERERGLRGHPWARETMTSWVLADGRDILASCETFRMRSTLAAAEGFTFGVASVYTEPHLRGRGYATQMMRELVETLKREEPRTHGSILFSDVGEALYARAGFVPRPSLNRSFEPEAGHPGEGVDALFDEGALPAEWEQVRWPAARYRVMPTAGQLDWHLERERLYSRLLGLPRLAACGARLGRSRVFWAGNLKASELVVAWLDCAEVAEAVVLLRSARRVAGAAGLKRVVLWECPVPFSWPAGDGGGRLLPRADSLTMIAPLGDGLEAGDFQHPARALWI